MRTRKIIAGYC